MYKLLPRKPKVNEFSLDGFFGLAFSTVITVKRAAEQLNGTKRAVQVS
jgi:hypothetical protein